jgi:hypothetical protein
MLCWPDLWNRAVEFRWVAWPILVLVVIVLLIWAPGIKIRWLRISLRLVGGAAALFAVVLLSFPLMLIAGQPEPEYRTFISPTGSHAATLKYSAGFLGRDFSTVKVTKKGCCQHFTAYEYLGPSFADATVLSWDDESHLRIRYRFDPARYQQCESRVADVVVICEAIGAGKNQGASEQK